MPSDLLKTVPQYIIPKRGLTSLAGLLANVKTPKIKNYIIQQFIKTYQVNMAEALIEDPNAYATFNEFFIRHLKPGCRPLANADLISPVDGCISEIGAIAEGSLVQAKGRHYSVQELLACDEHMARQFDTGCFATLYLSPKDYHRVHMPLAATLRSMTYIPGALFSVQPTTARVIPKLFARNERLAVFFDTSVGPMVMVMVGATIVGAIATSWHGELERTKKRVSFDYSHNVQMGKTLTQGEEMGFFKLGSTVVLLFADGERIDWNPTLRAGNTIRYGEELGSLQLS
jgi:phosphatidylserine decarboxylase